MASESTITLKTITPPLQDRISIVTGASRVIGRAIAFHFASLGAKLIINYTSNSTKADLVAAEINSFSSGRTPRAITFGADDSDPTKVKSIFDEAERVFRRTQRCHMNFLI